MKIRTEVTNGNNVESKKENKKERKEERGIKKMKKGKGGNQKMKSRKSNNKWDKKMDKIEPIKKRNREGNNNTFNRKIKSKNTHSFPSKKHE